MTLEEEFRKHFGNDIDGENLIQGIISFISSREEKAREEGWNDYREAVIKTTMIPQRTDKHTGSRKVACSCDVCEQWKLLSKTFRV